MNYQNVSYELSAGRANQLPKSTVPEVVFSGRSNVGKSSLINKLLNRKAIARVSATPGKTATINFFQVDTCRFADLPGYGYAKVSKSERDRWAGLVEGYFAQNRNIALVLQLVDIRRMPTEDDQNMIDFLLQSGLPFAVVCTKSDKLNKTEFAAQTAAYEELFSETGVPLVFFSVPKNIGVEELRTLVEQAVQEKLEAKGEKV